MPVVECSCGMVMSLSARDPRTCCIRCGGVELHILPRRDNSQRIERSTLSASAAGGARPTMALPGIATVMADALSYASHI